MAAKKWTADENQERLIGAAKAMVDGLIADFPDLAMYEASIVRTIYDFGEIVGNHVADFENVPDLSHVEAEDDFGTAPAMGKTLEPKAVAFTFFGPIDFVAVA